MFESKFGHPDKVADSIVAPTATWLGILKKYNYFKSIEAPINGKLPCELSRFEKEIGYTIDILEIPPTLLCHRQYKCII